MTPPPTPPVSALCHQANIKTQLNIVDLQIKVLIEKSSKLKADLKNSMSNYICLYSL